jgi:hypothetical protein
LDKIYKAVVFRHWTTGSTEWILGGKTKHIKSYNLPRFLSKSTFQSVSGKRIQRKQSPGAEKMGHREAVAAETSSTW